MNFFMEIVKIHVLFLLKNHSLASALNIMTDAQFIFLEVYKLFPPELDMPLYSLYYNCPNCIYMTEVFIYDSDTSSGEATKTLKLYSKSGVAGYLFNSPVNTSDMFHVEIANDLGGWLRSQLIDRKNWMKTIKSQIEPLSLAQIIIPGTHHSAAHKSTSISADLLHQTYDISSQLNKGIRFLHLTIGCTRSDAGDTCTTYDIRNDDGKILEELQKVLHQISQFLTHTEEIVMLYVMDNERDFNEDDRKSAMQYIKNQLSHHMYPFDEAKSGWSTPLSEYWKINKRLVVIYTPNNKSDPAFWPEISNYACNCNYSSQLMNFLAEVHETQQWKDASVPYAVGAVIQQDWRYFANVLGELIVKNYHENFTNNTNIVLVDFFETTGIVDVAYIWNTRRH